MSNKEEEFKKHQGLLLRKARKEARFSQEQVGTKLGVSQDIVSKLEKGDQAISSYRLLELAKLYEKPITFFYMGNVSKI